MSTDRVVGGAGPGHTSGVRRALPYIVGLVVASFAVAGCTDTDRRRRGLPADAGSSAVADSAMTDSRVADGAVADSRVADSAPVDSGVRDSAVDSAALDSSAADGGPLDPSLSPADPSGTACATPGSMGECPGIAVCRFYTSAEGRCESCELCGNLGGSCSSSDECDILFVCYSGRCSNICPLGTSFCGPPDACLNVGHPTHGVCDPDR